MKIYNISLTQWLFFLLIATSLSAQERILVEKPVTQEQQVYGDFSLSADHIALTVTPKEIGLLNIEVFFLSDYTFPVLLEVAECPKGAECALPDSIVKNTKIVQLSVKIKKTTGVLKQDSLTVKASGDGKEKFLKVLIFVANPPPLNYAISLGVSPEQPLEYGTIQPIEGRVVPNSTGNVILNILDPDNKQLTIPLALDSLGYFAHNYIFRHSGRWSAQATFKRSKEETVAKSNKISFTISKRKPRIAVTTIEPWKKNIGDTLDIVGQIVADEDDIAKLTAELTIHAPSRDTSVQVPLGTEGQFSYKYLVTDSGFHRIVASPIGESFSLQYSPESSTLYAFSSNYHGEANEDDNPAPSSPPVGKAEFNIGEFEHAIILEGGGTCYPSQNYVANKIIEILERRQIQNILPFRCTDDTCNRSIEDCKQELQDFFEGIMLESENGISDDSLIIIVIGQGDLDQTDKNTIEFCEQKLPAENLIELFKIDVNTNYLSDFAQVTWLTACDYSGDFLFHPVESSSYGLNIVITSTDRNTSDNLCDCDLSNDFLGQFFDYIDCDCGIKEAFYESRESPILPQLDDNGIDNKPDGNFDSNETSPYYDGLNSENVFIGLNSGESSPPPKFMQKDVVASPIGPLLSNKGCIVVALDNPGKMPVKAFVADVFPPENSDMSQVQVPLVYDSTYGAYKSKLLCFSDSGRYHIRLNYSYLDEQQQQRFRTSSFEKIRYVVPEDTTTTIVDTTKTTCIKWTATPLFAYFYFDDELHLNDSPSYRLRLTPRLSSRFGLEAEAGYSTVKENFNESTQVAKSGFLFDIGGGIAFHPITRWNYDPYFSLGGGWLTFRKLSSPHSGGFLYFKGGLNIQLTDLWRIIAEAKYYVIYDVFGQDKSNNVLISIGAPFNLPKICWKR